MKYGYTTVAAAVPTVTVADCAANADRIIELLTQAHQKNASLVVFPELSAQQYQHHRAQQDRPNDPKDPDSLFPHSIPPV